MSTKHLRNVTIAEFQAFLELCLCKYIRTKGGHEIWTRADLRRPVTFQTHIVPVPEFIVLNNLRTLGYTKKDYFEVMERKKEVSRNGDSFTFVKVN